MNKYTAVGMNNLVDSNDATIFLLSYLMGGFDYYYFTSVSPSISSFVPIVSTPFLFSDPGVELIQKSTYCNYSARAIALSYPLEGSLVLFFGSGSSLSDFELTIKTDSNIFNSLGDYVIIPVGFSTQSLKLNFMVIGISKVTKTDAFTPFSTVFAGGYYVNMFFYDFDTLSSYISEISNSLIL